MFTAEGLAGGGQCAVVSCVQVYFRLLVLRPIHQGGEGAVWSVLGAGRLSHTAYQCRIKLFVPYRVTTRPKEKQKASLLSASTL